MIRVYMVGCERWTKIVLAVSEDNALSLVKRGKGRTVLGNDTALAHLGKEPKVLSCYPPEEEV